MKVAWENGRNAGKKEVLKEKKPAPKNEENKILAELEYGEEDQEDSIRNKEMCRIDNMLNETNQSLIEITKSFDMSRSI